MKTLLLTFTAIWDLSVLLFVMPILRIVMIHSRHFDGAAPQWVSHRYWQAGIFAATTYFLFALTSGFYSRKKNIKYVKIPTINFAIFAYIFFLGLVACWRYDVITSGMQFMSKRILFFSIVISYFLTTSIHYIISFYLNKKEEL